MIPLKTNLIITLISGAMQTASAFRQSSNVAFGRHAPLPNITPTTTISVSAQPNDHSVGQVKNINCSLQKPLGLRKQLIQRRFDKIQELVQAQAAREKTETAILRELINVTLHRVEEFKMVVQFCNFVYLFSFYI